MGDVPRVIAGRRRAAPNDKGRARACLGFVRSHRTSQQECDRHRVGASSLRSHVHPFEGPEVISRSNRSLARTSSRSTLTWWRLRAASFAPWTRSWLRQSTTSRIAAVLGMKAHDTTLGAGNAFNNLKAHEVTAGRGRISYVVRLVRKDVKLLGDQIREAADGGTRS